MSFIKGLKRAFGFSTDGDELDNDIEYYDGAARSGLNKNASGNTGGTWVSGTGSAGGDKVDAPNASDEPGTDRNQAEESLVASIVDIINGNLSPVVLGCLDIEAEKAALKKDLGPQVQQIIERIQNEATVAANASWQAQLSAANAALNAEQEKTTAAVNSANELKTKLQTAELQNKTQANRLAEVEARNQQVEAELEQYSLENKGLVNKTKVLAVLEQQKTELENDVTRLSALLNEQRTKTVQQDNRIAQLEKQLENGSGTEDSIKKEFEEEIAKVEAFKEKKNAEISDLRKQIDEFNRRETLVNEEARAKLILAEEKQAQLNAVIEKLRKEIKDGAEARQKHDINVGNHIDDLKRQLATAAKRNEDFLAQVNSLTKANEQQMSLTGEATQERDNLREELRKTQNQLTKTQNELDKANKLLSQTRDKLEENNDRLRQAEQDLNQATERLAATAATTPAPEIVQKSEPDSAIDLDDLDWLVPVPPRKPEPEPEDEPDPEPKRPLADERQISLF